MSQLLSWNAPSFMSNHLRTTSIITVLSLILIPTSVFSAASSNATVSPQITSGMLTQTSSQAVVGSNASVSRNGSQQTQGSPANAHWLTEALNSNLAAALVGLLGGAAGFVVAQGWELRKKRDEENQRYCCILESTASELNFYADKLNFLCGQLQQFQDRGVVPSYTFYPGLLEQSKLRLNEFMRNHDIVKQVGHCHFELGHICERLVIFKKQAGETNPAPMVASNLTGFKNLVDSSIPVFRATATALLKESKTVASRENDVKDG